MPNAQLRNERPSLTVKGTTPSLRSAGVTPTLRALTDVVTIRTTQFKESTPPTSFGGGSPIGLLLALTYASSILTGVGEPPVAHIQSYG